MQKDTEAFLRSVLNFIGASNIPEQTIKNAVNFSQFENMKRLERIMYFKDPRMRPLDINNEESYKVRKGKVGGYLNYLSKEDIEFIDRAIQEAGRPFL